MPRLPPGATVLCGAGASGYSRLPSGAKLALLAFNEVARGTGVYPPEAIDAVAQQLDNDELRLEVLLDLMAREVPARTLAGVYSVLKGAKPTRPHNILVRLGVPIVTTNQDELIELATPANHVVDVLHLHGQASDLDSVMTMLSQYVEGLPQPIADAFAALVTGRHVVVYGYSGRDRDIMPFLYHAHRITWLQYRRWPDPAPLFPEAQLLKDRLRARMRVIELPEPAEWLFDRLPASHRREVDNLSAAALPISFVAALSTAAQTAFDAVSLRDRRLALARVLVHCNEAEYAYNGLRKCVRSWPQDARVVLRMAATAEVVQRRPEALRRYARATLLTVDPVLKASALLGRAHVNANGSDHATALDELKHAMTAAQRISDPHVRRRLLTRITNLRARIHAMTNHEAQAARDYRHAADLAERNNDLDGKVTAKIFGSDALHSRGRYLEALDQLSEVMEDNATYGRPQTRMWALFYRGLTLCSMGRLKTGMGDLNACRDEALRTDNRQAMAWAEVAIASYVRRSNVALAEQHLTACRAAIKKHGLPLTVCDVRLEWEYAELARARGAWSEALDRLDALDSRLRDPGLGMAMPYMPPHLVAVRGEIARERGDAGAADLLRDARRTFRAGGWRHSAVRMEVALWLLRGDTRPPASLVDRCSRYGYGNETRRLHSHAKTYYPLHSW
ncbi:hypothetical protein EIY87_22080 [Amycolatopsis eburnea]|uniref:Uncharacterized protein n=1 Tax=Amycolatopsis eburnea TaxID=2267691 RepID=A0A427T7J6_9PSEU|nr:hypothetical protein EIY87_22080 [Amycolatopsis eburnea]